MELHRSLVAIPSVSGDEDAIATFAEDWLARAGGRVRRFKNNVLATLGTPRLLFNTHLDTVPPTAAWSRDPFCPTVVEGRVYGLGSNDAKASAAAMMQAYADCAASGMVGLALMLAAQEETGGEGTEAAWPYARDELNWRPGAIVVGEPTGLRPADRQRGLLALWLVAKGIAGHAANSAPDGSENPVVRLAQALARLPHSSLRSEGHTLQPTVLVGSTARNQVPAEARAFVDVRTAPGGSHERVVERLRAECGLDVEVASQRLEPYACPQGAPILEAIRRVRPGAEPFESATMSDLAFFRGEPAVKWGPGLSERSHTTDEFVLESEILEGRDAYVALAREICR